MTKKYHKIEYVGQYDPLGPKKRETLPIDEFFEFAKTQWGYGTITEAFYNRLVLWGLAINKDAFERGQKTKNK